MDSNLGVHTSCKDARLQLAQEECSFQFQIPWRTLRDSTQLPSKATDSNLLNRWQLQSRLFLLGWTCNCSWKSCWYLHGTPQYLHKCHLDLLCRILSPSPWVHKLLKSIHSILMIMCPRLNEIWNHGMSDGNSSCAKCDCKSSSVLSTVFLPAPLGLPIRTDWEDPAFLCRFLLVELFLSPWNEEPLILKEELACNRTTLVEMHSLECPRNC